MKILGYFLILLPFILIFILSVNTIGAKETFWAVGVSFLILATTGLGVYLMQ